MRLTIDRCITFPFNNAGTESLYAIDGVCIVLCDQTLTGALDAYKQQATLPVSLGASLDIDVATKVILYTTMMCDSMILTKINYL